MLGIKCNGNLSKDYGTYRITMTEKTQISELKIATNRYMSVGASDVYTP